MLGIEHQASELVGEQFALVAGAVEVAVEAAVDGVAEFLQQGACGGGEIEGAAVELVAVHIDALAAGVAHMRVGRKGAVQLAVGAQVDIDAQARAAEGGQQGLHIGAERCWIGAGIAEDIGQKRVAIRAAEQIAQIAAGIGERLLPQAFGLGAEHRSAVVDEHVLLGGLEGTGEVHQQGGAGAKAAVGDAEIEAFGAAGAEGIEAPVGAGLEAVGAAAAVQIQRAVAAGLAEVVADAIEAGSGADGALQSVAEGPALRIAGGEAAGCGAEAVLCRSVEQADGRQAAELGRVVDGHHLHRAGEVGAAADGSAVGGAAGIAEAQQADRPGAGGGVVGVGVLIRDRVDQRSGSGLAEARAPAEAEHRGAAAIGGGAEAEGVAEAVGAGAA